MSHIGDVDECRRVVIAHVTPEVDSGRFAIKRIAGDSVHVEADIFAEGHDELAGRILYKRAQDAAWQDTPLTLQWNDHWYGDFLVPEVGCYVFKLEAWVERYETWRHDLQKRLDAGQDVDVELLTGAAMMQSAAQAAYGEDADRLSQRALALVRHD